MSKLYDDQLVAETDQAVAALIARVLVADSHSVVVGEAPAGAGKSYAITSAVIAALDAGLRVAVASPTNEQAFSLIDEMAKRVGKKRQVTFVAASGKRLPDYVAAHPNVVTAQAKNANNDDLIVGTLSKLGDAFARETLQPVDLLLVDEAFQANAVHYYGVGGLADRHLLMGDRGQLAPFTTAKEGHTWRGLDEDPLLTAVEVIQRNHPTTTHTYKLPISRRLDPRGVEIARAFYPGHRFGAAVREGVRVLELSKPKRKSALDHALEAAASAGWAHLELDGLAETLADPTTIDLIVKLVLGLLSRTPMVSCERQRKPKPLLQSQVAVVVSHNDQKNLLRAELDARDCGDVIVNTANKLQGLTYEVVIAWHPLAGLTDVDEFHLDPGRLCVMLTRHRQACIVVGRAADRQLVEGIPPSCPAYVGWDSAPALDGWYAHEKVFRLLEKHRWQVPS